jgi:hypothetical protein
MPSDDERFDGDRNILKTHYLIDAVRDTLSLTTADAFLPELLHIGFAGAFDGHFKPSGNWPLTGWHSATSPEVSAPAAIAISASSMEVTQHTLRRVLTDHRSSQPRVSTDVRRHGVGRHLAPVNRSVSAQPSKRGTLRACRWHMADSRRQPRWPRRQRRLGAVHSSLSRSIAERWGNRGAHSPSTFYVHPACRAAR